MTETAEKTSLRNLTLANIKTLAAIERLLKTDATPQRDKKIFRVLKELEIVNDEAMRIGLNLSAPFIARAKTGRVRPQHPPTKDQQRGADHAALMKFHFDHIKGPIADGPAQGAAIKWLLDNYSPDVLRQCYEFQTTEKWRSNVSWISVKRDIGQWLNQPRRSASKADSSIEAGRRVAEGFRQSGEE